jgi:hypothetical protein
LVPLFLIVVVVWLTFSRGAWVGLLLGFAALFWLIRGTATKTGWLVATAVLLIGSVVLVAAVTAGSATSTTDLMARASSILVPTEGSFATRLEIWKTALRIVRERPLLGTGPDTFVFRFVKFQTVKYIQLQNRVAVADNAHSYPLQLAATVGIPGAATFLALFFGLCALSVRQISKETDIQLRVLTGGFAAGALAYLVHLLFAVSSVGSTALVWMAAGVMVAQNGTSEALRVTWDKKTSMPRLALVALGLTLGLGVLSLAVRPYLADFYFSRGEGLAGIASWEEATGEFERAIRLNPANDRYKAELGLMYFTWSQAMENNRGLFDQAIHYVNEAKRSSPLMVDHYHILAFMFRHMGRTVDPKFLESAKNELEAALSLEPNSPRERTMLASVYLEQGKTEQALAELRRAGAVKPNYPPLYLYLGSAYRARGELGKARDAYETALGIDPDYQEARDALAELADEKSVH